MNEQGEGSMNKSRMVALASAVLSGLALSPQVAASREVTLRLHTLLPTVANPMKHFMAPWAQKAEKEPKGRIKVRVFPSMQLGGKATQLPQQVRDGVADIVWTLPGFTPGVMPKIEVFELPFLHRDARSNVLALQDYVAKHMK
jgi:TRAP-type C4-dicarboxylate transport system substrate-binding protein